MAFGKKTETKDRNQKNITSLPKGVVTIISQGTEIEGIVRVNSDVRIDGIVTGDVHSEKKVVVGGAGKIIGNIYCHVLELSGIVEGNVFGKEAVKMNGTASLKGDLNAPKFSIEMGAKFVGRSTGGEQVNEKKQTTNVKVNNIGK